MTVTSWSKGRLLLAACYRKSHHLRPVAFEWVAAIQRIQVYSHLSSMAH